MKKKIKYKKSIVTFFDILGFEKRVDKPGKPEELYAILNNFKHQSDPEMFGPSLTKFTNFSDTTVRTTTITSKENRNYQVGILFHELLDLIYTQTRLINIGVFIRGGVVIGDIYHDRDIVFGPGLNEAYRLEKEIAIYPRIIIDPEVLKVAEREPLLKASHHDIPTEMEYLRGLVRESSDGVWFLDYLWASREEFNDPYEYGQFLLTHKKRVLDCVASQGTLDKVSAKYLWTVHYHNDVVGRIRAKVLLELCGLEKSQLIITRNEIKSLYKFKIKKAPVLDLSKRAIRR